MKKASAYRAESEVIDRKTWTPQELSSLSSWKLISYWPEVSTFCIKSLELRGCSLPNLMIIKNTYVLHTLRISLEIVLLSLYVPLNEIGHDIPSGRSLHPCVNILPRHAWSIACFDSGLTRLIKVVLMLIDQRLEEAMLRSVVSSIWKQLTFSLLLITSLAQ